LQRLQPVACTKELSLGAVTRRCARHQFPICDNFLQWPPYPSLKAPQSFRTLPPPQFCAQLVPNKSVLSSISLVLPSRFGPTELTGEEVRAARRIFIQNIHMLLVFEITYCMLLVLFIAPLVAAHSRRLLLETLLEHRAPPTFLSFLFLPIFLPLHFVFSPLTLLHSKLNAFARLVENLLNPLPNTCSCQPSRDEELPPNVAAASRRTSIVSCSDVLPFQWLCRRPVLPAVQQHGGIQHVLPLGSRQPQRR
jgi:hypothetical protein